MFAVVCLLSRRQQDNALLPLVLIGHEVDVSAGREVGSYLGLRRGQEGLEASERLPQA